MVVVRLVVVVSCGGGDGENAQEEKQTLQN